MDLSCVLSCVIFTVQGGYTLRNAAQSASAFDTQKRGYLFRAKLIEGKKKVKYVGLLLQFLCYVALY